MKDYSLAICKDDPGDHKVSRYAHFSTTYSGIHKPYLSSRNDKYVRK